MDQIAISTLQIFSTSIIRYFLIAGFFFLLFYILFSSRWKRMKIQHRQASRKDFIREIGHSMQSTLVFTVITAFVFFSPLRAYTQIYDSLSDFPGWYIPISVMISLFIHDTYFYWMHRIVHHPKLFKAIHLVHHQSTNPSPWTSYSFHFLESVLEGFVLIIITVIMPMHPIGLLSFTIAAFIINVYGHLGYEIMPKGLRHSWLFEVINTSVHHNLHHSKFKGNYGLYFRFWDRLMGTEHPDYVKEYDKIQENRFGGEKTSALR